MKLRYLLLRKIPTFLECLILSAVYLVKCKFRYSFSKIYRDFFLADMEDIQRFYFEDRSVVKIEFDTYFLEWLRWGVKGD